jgi:hypothetical protein
MADEPNTQASEPTPTVREDMPAEEAKPTAQAAPEPQGWRYRVAHTAETMLSEQPLFYKPIAKPLRILARSARLQRMLLGAQRSDPEQNAATTPPPNESVQLAALWVIELYTPSTVGHLARALQRLRWLHSTAAGQRDYSAWLTDQRARATEAYVEIATIAPEKPQGLYGKKGPVPGEFCAINLTLYALTPSLTALVACFVVNDDNARQLDAVLRRDVHTTGAHKKGIVSIVAAEGNKTLAACRMRQRLQRSAVQWIARYFPGVFTRGSWVARLMVRRWRARNGILRGEIPVVELILLEEAHPREALSKEAAHRRYVRILGIGSYPSWASDAVDGLLLSEPSGWRNNYAPSQHTLTLAVLRRTVGDALGARDATNWQLIFGLQLRLLGVFTRWALTAFLEGENSQLSVIRDYAERGIQRLWRSRRRLLLRILLRAGLDSRTCGREIQRLDLPSGGDIFPFPPLSLVNPGWGPK